MNWIDKVRAENPSVPDLWLPRRFEAPLITEIPDGTLKAKTILYLQKFYEVAPLGIGCLFLGRAGKYKTYASALIAKTIHDKVPLETRFVQCPIVVNQIERSRFSKESEEKIRDICHIPFVVMDDFSQVSPNSFGAGVLLEIAEHRFSNLLPTIWTGNITTDNPTPENVLKSLSSLYGPSFGRRVAEASRGFGVYVK